MKSIATSIFFILFSISECFSQIPIVNCCEESQITDEEIKLSNYIVNTFIETPFLTDLKTAEYMEEYNIQPDKLKNSYTIAWLTLRLNYKNYEIDKRIIDSYFSSKTINYALIVSRNQIQFPSDYEFTCLSPLLYSIYDVDSELLLKLKELKIPLEYKDKCGRNAMAIALNHFSKIGHIESFWSSDIFDSNNYLTIIQQLSKSNSIVEQDHYGKMPIDEFMHIPVSSMKNPVFDKFSHPLITLELSEDELYNEAWIVHLYLSFLKEQRVFIKFFKDKCTLNLRDSFGNNVFLFWLKNMDTDLSVERFTEIVYLMNEFEVDLTEENLKNENAITILKSTPGVLYHDKKIDIIKNLQK